MNKRPPKANIRWQKVGRRAGKAGRSAKEVSQSKGTVWVGSDGQAEPWEINKQQRTSRTADKDGLVTKTRGDRWQAAGRLQRE